MITNRSLCVDAHSQTGVVTVSLSLSRILASVSNGSGFGPEKRFGSVPEPSKNPTRSDLAGQTRHLPVNPRDLPGLARPVGSNLRFCVLGFSICGHI